MSEVTIAFPMRVEYQQLEELVKIDKSKLFLAQPPQSSVPKDSMTAIQQWAIKLGVARNSRCSILLVKQVRVRLRLH